MNILIACDTAYYFQWTINCIKSIKKFVPWINIIVVIVNAENITEIDGVKYIYEHVDFADDENKIAYYQAVRFLKCADLFPNGELVMSIDCDTILTRSFSEKDFKKICRTVHVQRHQKANRWMAGLVTYGDNNDFRIRIRDQLLSRPRETWEYGWDQKILNHLAIEFNYQKLEVGDWMSFGKGNGIFLTLKGDQKISPKHLDSYKTKLGNLL